MSELQEPSKEAGKSDALTSLRSKRKLMPLRNRINLDIGSSQLELCDVDSEEKALTMVAIACPYGAKEKRSRNGKGKPGKMYPTKTTTDAPFQQKGKGGKQGPVPARTIVCTFMNREDVELVSKAIQKLGTCEIEDNVSSRTSHVVCGDEKRTINLMHGIAYGCWILNLEWVKESVKAGYWIGEEEFEVQAFPAAKQSRVARKRFGRGCNIFNNGDKYYVSHNTSPPHTDMTRLLQLFGAIITTSAIDAQVALCSKSIKPPPGVIEVNVKWALDSIVQNALQPKANYLI